LLAARLAGQLAVDQPQQRLAMQAGHGLHLIEQTAAFLLAFGLPVANTHLVQVLPSFINAHWICFGHRSLGNIFF